MSKRGKFQSSYKFHSLHLPDHSVSLDPFVLPRKALCLELSQMLVPPSGDGNLGLGGCELPQDHSKKPTLLGVDVLASAHLAGTLS